MISGIRLSVSGPGLHVLRVWHGLKKKSHKNCNQYGSHSQVHFKKL